MRSTLGIIAMSAVVALVASQTASAQFGSGVTGGDRLRVGSFGARRSEPRSMAPDYYRYQDDGTTYRSYSHEPGATAGQRGPAPTCCTPAPRCCFSGLRLRFWK